MSVSKLNGVTWADISKVNGVGVADIEKVKGVEVTASSAPSLTTDNLWIDIRPYVGVNGTTVTDQSGNSRNATIVGTNPSSVVTTTPTNETAFFLDGVDQAVLYTITSASDKPSTGFPFTTEAWIYRDDTQNSTTSTSVWGKPQNSRYRMFYTSLVQDDAASFSSGARVMGRFMTNRTTDADDTFYADGQADARPTTTSGVTNSCMVGSPTTTSYNNRLSSDTSDHTWYHLVTAYYENSSGELCMDFWVNGSSVYTGFKETKNNTGQSSSTNSAWPWEGSVGSDSSSKNGNCPMEWGHGRIHRSIQSASNAGINYYDGYYGGYRMYTKKLSNTEVSNNFNATKTNYGY